MDGICDPLGGFTCDDNRCCFVSPTAARPWKKTKLQKALRQKHLNDNSFQLVNGSGRVQDSLWGPETSILRMLSSKVASSLKKSATQAHQKRWTSVRLYYCNTLSWDRIWKKQKINISSSVLLPFCSSDGKPTESEERNPTAGKMTSVVHILMKVYKCTNLFFFSSQISTTLQKWGFFL